MYAEVRILNGAAQIACPLRGLAQGLVNEDYSICSERFDEPA
jgi:hypothetical protein